MGAAPRVDDPPRGLLEPYVPRVLLRHLVEAPNARVQAVEGTLLFADVSGFTRLSERLARRGREGAEELVETIGACFSQLLAVTYDNGGGLLKFGGDALLLKFEGEDHLARAARSAVGMRRHLREAGPLQTSAGRVTLRISQGLHSGEIPLFLVGASHREHLIAGPTTSVVVEMEKVADAGEIVVSPEAARRLPQGCVGAAKGAGRLLTSAPAGAHWSPNEPWYAAGADAIAQCLPVALREHLASGRQPPEHRSASTAFLRASGVDDVIARDGIDAAADALHELVCDVQEAADAQQICFLASDIGANEVRILLTAGAPRVVGDDEDRMLLAMRRVIEGNRRLPVHIGVNRGNVFCGDVGPHYRRTYAVMGDATNLSARLMARAPAGELYATARVLDRATTRFDLRALEPFTVKGKARPVEAWSVGPAVGGRARERVAEHFPLVGREREVAALDKAIAAARRGTGRIVELAGEEGIGKSRLLDELRRRAAGMRRLHAACEPYSASSPYATWRELLRPLLGVAHDEANDVVLARLTAVVEDADPTLLPWLPLLAIAVDADAPLTPEVEALAPEFRTARLRDVVVQLLERLLAGATLIEIEDAHHMDHASADLLAALAEVVGGAPWLVAVTRRDVASGFVAPDLPAVVRLEPAPLDRAALLALAEAVTEAAPLPPHVLALAVDRSGGSPQFLRDLLRAAASATGDGALPESIEAAAMARMDLLAPSDRALIRRAALLGRTFDQDLLVDVLDDGVSWPDERTWARLWRYFEVHDDGSVQFRSAVVREAAYAAMTYRLRRRLHAVVGARLEREAGPAAEESAAVLSLHFERAGDHRRAWHYARIAADRARGRFAYADAATLYRRALDASRGLDAAPTEVATVWEALGAAHGRIGELDAAHEAFRAARKLLGGDVAREAQLLHSHARVDLDAGRVAPAARWALRALRAADRDPDPAAMAGRARATSTLATIRQRQGRMADAIDLCHRAIAEAEAAREEAALANACYVLDWALVESGRPGEAVHSQRALEIYGRLGEINRQAAVLNNMGGFAYRDGRWRDAVDLYRRGAEASLRAGDAADAAFGDCNIGEVLADRGQLDEAQARLRRALRTWRGSGYDWGVAYATAILGRAATRAGRHDEAIDLLADAARRFRELRVLGDLDWVEALLAEAEAFAGRADAALTRADLALAGLGDPGRLGALLHRVRGFAFAQLDDLAAAEDALEASLAQARAHAEEYEVAVTLDALKALSVLTGRAEPPERSGERDAILARLDVERLPAPPLSAGATLAFRPGPFDQVSSSGRVRWTAGR
jgi:class 3 adenylate cyclase/tetratricopeptide (TPR) repeat protein